MGPKFYACVAMSHDKKCLCRMIRISKLCLSHIKSGVSPLISPPCRSCRFLPMYTPRRQDSEQFTIFSAQA